MRQFLMDLVETPRNAAACLVVSKFSIKNSSLQRIKILLDKKIFSFTKEVKNCIICYRKNIDERQGVFSMVFKLSTEPL